MSSSSSTSDSSIRSIDRDFWISSAELEYRRVACHLYGGKCAIHGSMCPYRKQMRRGQLIGRDLTVISRMGIPIGSQWLSSPDNAVYWCPPMQLAHTNSLCYIDEVTYTFFSSFFSFKYISPNLCKEWDGRMYGRLSL